MDAQTQKRIKLIDVKRKNMMSEGTNSNWLQHQLNFLLQLVHEQEIEMKHLAQSVIDKNNGNSDLILKLAKYERVLKADMVIVDRRRLDALEHLYQATHDRNVCEEKFDACGQNDDGEGQTMILPYIHYYQDEIDKVLVELESSEPSKSSK